MPVRAHEAREYFRTSEDIAAYLNAQSRSPMATCGS